ILLLDEPLSMVDPGMRRNLQQDLKMLHERLQTTTIHVTHNFEEALALADRIGIIQSGQLLQVGTPSEVFQNPKSRHVAEFLGIENLFSGVVKRVPGTEEEGKFNAVFCTDAGIDLAAVSEIEGPAFAYVRPEEIVISLEPFESSARNDFSGTIREISDDA